MRYLTGKLVKERTLLYFYMRQKLFLIDNMLQLIWLEMLDWQKSILIFSCQLPMQPSFFFVFNHSSHRVNHLLIILYGCDCYVLILCLFVCFLRYEWRNSAIQIIWHRRRNSWSNNQRMVWDVILYFLLPCNLYLWIK